MDKGILTFLFVLVFLIVITLIVEKNKPKRNWVTWFGIILTSFISAGFMASLLSGTLLQEGSEYLIAMISLFVLGIYLIWRKPKKK